MVGSQSQIMKPVEDVVACVVDYGTFICLAEKLSETCKKVYYHTPVDDEYRDAKDCVIGDGIKGITRADELVTPEMIAQVDLWVFPDIGWGGLQRYLRSIGKSVWGSMGADGLEQYRTKFYDLIKSMGMPVVKYEKIKGLTNLALYLKDHDDKWVKINRFRQNMETWHHVDWDHSQRMLEHLAMEFGGVKELITFVVMDPIETDLEVGYDGWCINGEYPDACFQGYEKKNELYLGSLLPYHDLPEAIKYVNEEMAPVLAKYGYCNDIATEIRILDDEFHFIDPTMRMPGQTGEQGLETCTNKAEVIWAGANGEVIKPEFACQYAAEATIHYTGCDEGWKTVRFPLDHEHFKLVHYCMVDGLCHFPPGANDEVGVVLGMGDTIEEAIENLHENFEEVKHLPVEIHDAGFVDLLKAVQAAEDEGVHFTDDKIPDPASVLE